MAGDGISYEVIINGRTWQVFKGAADDVGWYARLPLSQPQILLRADTEHDILCALGEWRPAPPRPEAAAV